MAHETARRCSSTTDRLVVDAWYRPAERVVAATSDGGEEATGPLHVPR